MHFRIEHTTEYRFERPVFLEPHQLRFHPRSDGAQLLRSFEIQVDPQPSILSQTLDPEGNVVTRAWFQGVHERLEIVARAEVETLRENPFDYLLTAKSCRLPVVYEPAEVAALALARLRQRQGEGVDAVYSLANRICSAQRGELIGFLSALNQAIYEQLETVCRDEGEPWAPAATLEMRRGACRDLAVLFMDACRSLGLAARFVSGYQQGDPDQVRRDLHAWAEVYIPGVGWRGYDPALGLAVADRHVAVAAATDPLLAAPVHGSYRGSPRVHEFHTEISLRVDECAAVPV